MVYHIILADIFLIARIFPRPCAARKNTTQLAKYPRILYDKPSNKMNLFIYLFPLQRMERLPALQVKWIKTDPKHEFGR